MSVFDVVGIVKYGQVTLQAGTVKFEKNSKLVLAPSEKNMNPPKSLTIIADKIEVVDRAEITYDFDGLPGFDPDTPAPPQAGTVPNGANGSWGPVKVLTLKPVTAEMGILDQQASKAKMA